MRTARLLVALCVSVAPPVQAAKTLEELKFELEAKEISLAKPLKDLDVRYEEEYDESYIPGSVLIPLQELRKRFTELDPEVPYIAYCKGGKRSAVASLLLTQRGLEAVSLTGGISEWPYEVVKNY